MYDESKALAIGASIPPTSAWLDTYKAAGLKTYTLVLFENSDGSFTYNETSLANTLRLCEQKGLKAEIRLHGALTRTAGYNVFTDKFPSLQGKLDEYPALTGFFIADEPSWSQLNNIEATYLPWFNQNYGGGRLEFFVNLLSGYSTGIGALRDINGRLVGSGNLYDGVNATLTARQKADFVKAYHNKWLGILAKVNSANKCFSHDCYPFFDNQTGWLQGANDPLPEGYEYYMLEEWFARSLNMANQARDNGYDFGVHIQTFDQTSGNYRLPTVLAEIAWQVYMNLAMGAKRIDYFGYDQNSGGSYMTLNGQPLPLYYLVQAANTELDKVDHVFASFKTWVGVKTFAALGAAKSAALTRAAALELESLTGVSSVTASRELVVGEMLDEKGNRGYMLVGFDDPLKGNFTAVEMVFDGADGFIVYRGGERTLIEAENGVFSATILAGEGVFIIPVYVD